MTKPRILIVEDEPFVSRDIYQQLKELGYEPVGETPRAEDSIPMVERLQPDLVLMDIHLEGEMDGIAAAQIIHDRFEIPVIFLTAFAGDEMLDRAKKSDSFGYIIKPFDERELRMVIEIGLYKHQSESKLRQTREEWETILRTLPDGFWLTDERGRILDVNEACCRMHGFTHDEMLEKSITDFEVDETNGDIAEGIEHIRQTGSAMFERRHRCKDGSLIDVELSITYLPGENGRFSVFLRDTTRRKQMEVALRWSEERATKAFRTIPDGILISRMADSMVLEVNDAFCRLSGLSREEVIGRTMPELDLWDRASDRDKYLEALRTKGCVNDMEAGFHNKAGEHRFVSLSAEMMDHGQDKLILVISHDITEKKQAEEALRESHQFNEQVIKSAHEGVIVYGLDLRYEVWNPYMEALTGKPTSEVLGKHPMEVFPFTQETGVIERLERALAGETPTPLEFPYIVPGTGKSGWASDTSAPFRNLKGEIIGVIGTVEDITERKQSEDALRLSEQTYSGILNSVTEAVYIQDENGVFLDVNLAAEKMYGYAKEEFIGRTPEFLSAPGKNDLSQLAPMLEKALNGEPQSFEFWGLRKDGTIFPKEVSNTLGYYFGKKVNIAVARDITERKRTEAALKENEDRFRDLVDNSREVITTYDLEGNFISVNDTAVLISGYPREALLKMNLSDLLAPKTRHLFADYLKNVRTLGKVQGIMRIQTAKGETRVWEYDSTMRTEGVSNPVVRGMARDITERRAAEKALGASEAQLQVILEATDDGILAVNHQGKILKTNRRFAELWRIPPSIIASGDDSALLDHVLGQLSDPEAFLDKVKSLYASDAKDLDLILFKDGRCFERFSSPMHEGTVVTGRVWSFRDITIRKQTEEALEENEERYRDLLDNSQEMIATMDLEGNFLSVNETTVHSTGFTREALLKMNLTDLIEPKSRQLFPDYLQALKDNGKVHGIIRIQMAGGELRFHEYDCTIRTEGVAEPLVRAMSLDITERLQAERALRTNESQLRVILESTDDGILAVDSQGNVLQANSRFADLWKIPDSIIAGGDDQALLDHVLPQLSEPEAFLKKVLARYRSDATYSDLIHFKDGRCYEHFSTPMMNGDSVMGRVSSFRDISERKQAEQVLQEITTTLQESQLIAGLGSYDLDIATELWKSSDVLDKIFGIDAGFERSLEGWTLLIHPDDRQMLVDYFANEVIGKRGRFDKEYRIIRNNDHAVRWVHGLGKLEFSPIGQPVRMLGNIQDITERKQAEEALRKQADELRVRNETLTRFYRVAVDRELRMIEMKREVNELCAKLGEPPRHRLGDEGAAPPPTPKAQP